MSHCWPCCWGCWQLQSFSRPSPTAAVPVAAEARQMAMLPLALQSLSGSTEAEVVVKQWWWQQQQWQHRGPCGHQLHPPRSQGPPPPPPPPHTAAANNLEEQRTVPLRHCWSPPVPCLLATLTMAAATQTTERNNNGSGADNSALESSLAVPCSLGTPATTEGAQMTEHNNDSGRANECL